MGSALRKALADSYDWIGLTRSEARATGGKDDTGTEWRLSDLYSFPKLETSMAGAEVAVYLVHSMLPSSRLTQANFANLDLLLADNFARASAAVGIKQIIYLGGLIPEDQSHLSPHLASRLEVEEILRSTGVPLTVLRAGIVFGPGGSSTQILLNLCYQLPVMVFPKWTSSLTQSVDIRHVTRAVDLSIGHPDHFNQTYDLASHRARSYGILITDTAHVIGKQPFSFTVPMNSFTLSKYWVSFFSGVSGDLVNPLLESLKHDLVARPNPLMQELHEDPISFEESIKNCLDENGHPVPNPRSQTQSKDNRLIQKARRVRSVQRLPLPPNWDAWDVADQYGNWLTRSFRGMIQVNRDDEGALLFQVAFPRITLLKLSPSPLTRQRNRQVFYITGGILARTDVDPPGRLEFRSVCNNQYVMAAIHGFSPALPWFIYNFTQAPVHLWVMHAFGRFLKRQNPSL